MTASLFFLKYVLSHLRRHRLRSGLTVLGVALGVAVAVAVQLANSSALAAFAGAVRAIAGEAKLQVVSPGGELDERILGRLRPLSDLAAFSPVVEGTAVLADRPGVAFRLMGVDLLAPAAFRAYEAGGGAAADLAPGQDGLFISGTAAERFALHRGDRLRLWINDRVQTLRIAGILRQSGQSGGLDPQVAFLDIAPAQELLRRVGRLDRLDVLPRPGVDLEALRASLAGLLPPGARVREPEQSNRQAEKLLAAFRVNLMALSFVALLVGAYLIYNTVAVSVVQRRGEVAVLRAVGATRRQIFAVFAAEAGVIGLLGAVLGLGLGSLLARGAVQAVARTVNSIYLAAPVQGVTWTPWAFATGLGAGVGLALAASLLPALEAARTAPALAMRPGSWEGRQRGLIGRLTGAGLLLLAGAALAAQGRAIGGLPLWGYLAATLLLAGCSLLSPLAVLGLGAGLQPLAGRAGTPLRLAVANFSAAAGRNAVAVAALMVGVMMMIGIATMVGSFRQTVTAWVGTVVPADFYMDPATARGAKPDATLDPALLPQVGRLTGVLAVEGFRSRHIAYRDTEIRLGASDMGVLANYGALVLRDGGDVQALLRSLVGSDRVVISEAFVIKQGVDLGQDVVLATPGGPHSFHVAGVYYDYSSDQGYVLMDRGTYRRYWDDDALSSIGVFARPGADATDLRRRIQLMLAGRPVDLAASGEIRRGVLRVFDNTFAITYALHVIAIAVSLLGVVTTLFTLVLERQREISLLRCLGLTRGQVRRMIVAEAGLLGAAGSLVGLAAGGLLSWLLIRVINRQSFGWTVQWHPPYGFIAGSLAVVVLAALVAGLFPAGVAARFPVAEGMRYE